MTNNDPIVAWALAHGSTPFVEVSDMDEES